MDSLVILDSFSNPVEAHIIKGLLEGGGIQCFIMGELSTAYTPLGVGGIRLAVRKSDLDRAKAFLSQEKQQVGGNKESDN